VGKKGKVTLYIDNQVVRNAKEAGLNLSKISENALKEATIRLKGKRGAK
jgi:post-segregation antitoxin (ccd killing protein)